MAAPTQGLSFSNAQLPRPARKAAVRKRLLAWQKWRAAVVERARARAAAAAKLQTAVQSLARSKARRTLAAWHNWHCSRAIQRLRHEQACGHFASRLLGATFRRWVALLLLRRAATAKFVAATCHWASALKQRSFQSWSQYLQRRRASRARKTDALEWRRQRYAAEGVRRWLQAGLEKRAQRARTAASADPWRTEKLWAKVARCAFHWLHLTRKSHPRGRSAFGRARP